MVSNDMRLRIGHSDFNPAANEQRLVCDNMAHLFGNSVRLVNVTSSRR